MSTLSSRIRDLAPGLKLRAERYQDMAREARHVVAESQAKLNKGVFSGEAARLQTVIRGQTARAKELDAKATFTLAEAKAASAGILLSTVDRTFTQDRDPRVSALISEGYKAGVVKKYNAADWAGEGYVPPPPEPSTLAEHRQARGLHPDPSTDPKPVDPQEQLRQHAIARDAELAETAEAERVSQAESTARAVEASQSAPQSARSSGMGLLVGGW